MGDQVYRVWYTPLENPSEDPSSAWDEIQKYPYIFLVHKPLTFGHSQLVIPNPIAPKLKKLSEEELFEEASKHVKKAIETFRKIFKDTSILKKFRVLAECTNTNGDYIKTLILRASADESYDEKYKVHLAPYFKSHGNDCGTGGLLRWVGERELRVDSMGHAEKERLKPELLKLTKELLKS